jgi:hypothetical protein
MPYIRKTVDEFVILGNYGQGWEELCIETSFSDLKENMKLYRQNEPGIRFTWKKRRVKIE